MNKTVAPPLSLTLSANLPLFSDWNNVLLLLPAGIMSEKFLWRAGLSSPLSMNGDEGSHCGRPRRDLDVHCPPSSNEAPLPLPTMEVSEKVLWRSRILITDPSPCGGNQWRPCWGQHSLSGSLVGTQLPHSPSINKVSFPPSHPVKVSKSARIWKNSTTSSTNRI